MKYHIAQGLGTFNNKNNIFLFIAVPWLPSTPSVRRLTLNCFRVLYFATTESRVTIGIPYALSDEETPLNISFIIGIMCFSSIIKNINFNFADSILIWTRSLIYHLRRRERLHCEGYSFRDVTKTVKVSYTAVCSAIVRNVEIGKNNDRQRSSWPKSTSKLKDNFIRITSLQKRNLTVFPIAGRANTSADTFRRRLTIVTNHCLDWQISKSNS